MLVEIITEKATSSILLWSWGKSIRNFIPDVNRTVLYDIIIKLIYRALFRISRSLGNFSELCGCSTWPQFHWQKMDGWNRQNIHYTYKHWFICIWYYDEYRLIFVGTYIFAKCDITTEKASGHPLYLGRYCRFSLPSTYSFAVDSSLLFKVLRSASFEYNTPQSES